MRQKDGKLLPPSSKIVDVNVQGVIYSTCPPAESHIIASKISMSATTLALHHMGDEKQAANPDRLKALVLIGSLCTPLSSLINTEGLNRLTLCSIDLPTISDAALHRNQVRCARFPPVHSVYMPEERHSRRSFIALVRW